MPTTSGYQPRSTGAGGMATGQGPGPEDKAGYWSLDRCKRAYQDYLGSKREEIDERTTARRMRHGSHWTAEQIKNLNDRKQPVVTYNRIGRKINGVVGLVERQRTDPKAYPRTPAHEEGADLATAVLRYVLDEQEWAATTPIVSDFAATDGLCGIALEIIKGDQGDPEIGLDIVYDDFFYDPRSRRLDFSDARYMGVGKWLDMDTAKEMIPDKAAEIEASLENGDDLTSNPDTDNKWFVAAGDVKRIRLVDLWYKHDGKWCYSLFTGSTVLMEGPSYLIDEKGNTECRYIMFSANVDHDGDRYGFVRDLKSANEEINQRRSKALHELHTRRVVGEVGAFDDVEKARREAARPDGFVLRNKGFEAEFDDAAKMASLEGQLRFLEEAKNEIDNFGPNQALLGQEGKQASGRALTLLQQAGMAELGPFILAYRGWKVRVYRAIWNAIQKHWQSERWIRVTDNEGLAEFLQINKLSIDPVTGAPTIVNAIGSLDVDIILDEGPDTVNLMADIYETLQQVVPAVAPLLLPQQAQAAVKLLIDTSPLPADSKKRFREASEEQPPDPMQEQAKALELAGAEAKVMNDRAAAELKQAQTQKTMADANGQQQPAGPDMVTEVRQTELDHRKLDLEEHKLQVEYAKTQLAAVQAAEAAKRPAGGEGEGQKPQGPSKDVMEAVNALMAVAMAPTRVVRGPDGSVVGAEKVISE